MVAKKFNTRHEILPVGVPSEGTLSELASRFNEPVSDDAAMALFQVSSAFKSEFSAVISGTGGDELFGGHSWQPLVIQCFNDLEKEGVWSGGSGVRPPGPVLSEYARKVVHCSHFNRSKLYSAGFTAGLSEGEDRMTAHIRRLIGRCARKDAINMVLDCDMKSFLAEYLCMNAYAVFSRSGMKMAAPFLNGELVSFVSRLPGRCRADGK